MGWVKKCKEEATLGGVPTDNFSRGEDVFNGGQEETIMDPITIGMIASLVISAASAAWGVHTYNETKDRMEADRKDQKTQIDQNKREAKAQAAFQYNKALANMRTGEVMARREELMEKRKEVHEDQHYGEPVDPNFWQNNA